MVAEVKENSSSRPSPHMRVRSTCCIAAGRRPSSVVRLRQINRFGRTPLLPQSAIQDAARQLSPQLRKNWCGVGNGPTGSDKSSCRGHPGRSPKAAFWKIHVSASGRALGRDGATRSARLGPVEVSQELKFETTRLRLAPINDRGKIARVRRNRGYYHPAQAKLVGNSQPQSR